LKSEFISILAGVFLGVGQPLMKYGMTSVGITELSVSVDNILKVITNLHFLLGGLISIIGIISLIIALSGGKASVLKALSGGSTYICILVLSYFLLFEEITLFKIIGVSLLIFGIYLLGMIGSFKVKFKEVEK